MIPIKGALVRARRTRQLALVRRGALAVRHDVVVVPNLDAKMDRYRNT